MDITDSIKYIGVDDTKIDLFENQYKVPNGISYNSYFIDDDKKVVLDTVDDTKTEEWLENIKNITSKVDYLVVSHVEPDHSGSIPEIIKKFPNIQLIGNQKTFEFIEQFYKLNLADDKKIIVKDGDTFNIGKHNLKFIMAPMIHWPEVMMTYEENEKVIFSADAFGKFGIRGTKEDWLDEARRYYINIVGKYGMQVQNLLKKISNYDIKIICPLHGEILKENLGYYIEKYDMWSSYKAEDNGILIIYATIHGNTEKAAFKMQEILETKINETTTKQISKENEENSKDRESKYNQIKIIDLARADISETISQAYKYGKIIFAASSYNMGVFPCMDNLLRQLISKNFQNRKIGIIENGSWAPSAGKVMKEILSQGKNLEIIEPMVTIKSSMSDENIEQMKELGNKIIEG